MCWFVYGAVQGDMDEAAMGSVSERHECRLVCGTRHDVKMAALYVDGAFRVTRNVCDCDSAIGAHDPTADEVRDLAGLMREVGGLPGAKTISCCKTWAGERNKRERRLKLAEVELERFLADLEPGTLYTLSCAP